jgi:hypothetical protein
MDMMAILNRVSVAAVIAALALAAGLLALATPAQAQSDTTARVPFSQDYVNGCLGNEQFHIDGTILIVGHATTDANGQNHFQFVENTQGTGASVTTGTKYTFKQQTHGEQNYLGDSLTYYV